MKSLSILRFLAARAAEPSTWAALAALAAISGHALPAYVPEVAAHIAAGVAGALGVLIGERRDA